MKKDWGFSAFVEINGKRILFDTGMIALRLLLT
jgi:metal-dependent hydrolase (beta-lactamase superfamily II)